MIVVFGSINLDLVARVERLPELGETIAGKDFATYPGGKGANQALAARRAGADVALFGAVGNDAFADSALAGLRDADVDLAGVRRVNAPTGTALIHVTARGKNAITVVAGANAHADPAALPDSLLTPNSTLLMRLEVPLPAVQALALRARSRGVRVIVNAAPAQSLPVSLLSLLDVLVVNEIEAAAIGSAIGIPTRADEFALAARQRFGCPTVVTLGERGALAVVGTTRIRASAPVLRVVDTTGAGDAFTGAFAAHLHRGTPWNRALAAGVAAGSLACAAAGAQSAFAQSAAIDKVASTVESGLVIHSLSPNPP